MYNYITKNNLEERQHYRFSEITDDLWDSYLNARNQILSNYKISVLEEKKIIEDFYNIKNKYYKAEIFFNEVIILKKEVLEEIIKIKNDNRINLELINSIVKTFEVRKRFYHCYNKRFKPLDESDYNDVSLYILISYLLVKVYEQTLNLKYLNGLLKINDTLISINEKIKEEYLKNIFYFTIKKEIDFILSLKNKSLGE